VLDPGVTPIFDTGWWMATKPALDSAGSCAIRWCQAWDGGGLKEAEKWEDASGEFHGDLGAFPGSAPPLYHNLNVPIERVQES